MALSKTQPLPWRAPWIRWLSVAAIAMLVAAPVTLMLSPEDASGAGLLRSLGMLLALVVLWRSTGARAPQPGELDEREQAERARAILVGSWVTAAMIGLVGHFALLHSVITSIPLPPLSLRLLGELLVSIFWIHVIVPSAVLAWRDPGTDED